MSRTITTTPQTTIVEAATATPVSAPQLSLHSISKTYSAKDGKVLDGVDLHVARGELVSLLGPSGCGKSTLLRMVAGFISVDEGRIEIAGRDITHVPTHRRNVGIVHQSHALWPHMTVAENVAFGLEMRKVKRPRREQLVSDMLAVVGLAGFERRLPPELSGGQQQRVALARALVIEPQVLLLDEPLSSLDANLRVYLRDEIRRIQKDLGVTTIFVTHDREEAMAVSDRIVLLQGGHIAQQGSAIDLYREPDSHFIMMFTGTTVNFEGRVDRSGHEPLVTIGVGRFPLSDAASVSRMLSDTVVVSLRPEDLGFVAPGSTPPPTALIFPGRLDQVMFLGTSVEARVTIEPGQVLEMRLHPRDLNLLPAVGSTIDLSIETDHLHVFAT
jgi:ABC-type Fe3+/spermidine/putrescine transport system ATPase subunit